MLARWNTSLVFILLALLQFSCAPKAKDFELGKTPVVKMKGKDYIAKTTFEPKKHIEFFTSEKQNIKTEDYFEMAWMLMSMPNANFLKNKDMGQFGRQLVYDFYQDQNNYSIACFSDSAYVNATLGVYSQKLVDASSKAFQEMYKNTFEALNLLKPTLSLEEQNKVAPSKVMHKMIEFLAELPAYLSKKNVGDKVVREVKAKLAVYEPILAGLENEIKKLEYVEDASSNQLHPSLQLQYSVVGLERVVTKLESLAILRPQEIESLKKMLDFPFKISKKIHQDSNVAEIAWSLVKIFDYVNENYKLQNLSNEERLKQIMQDLPPEMHTVVEMLFDLSSADINRILSHLEDEEFAKQNDETIAKEKKEEEEGYFDGYFSVEWHRRRFNESLMFYRAQMIYFGVAYKVVSVFSSDEREKLLVQIDSAINKRLAQTIDQRLKEIYVRLPSILNSVILPVLAKNDLDWYHNFEEKIRIEADNELKSRIFIDKDHYPALERDWLEWPMQKNLSAQKCTELKKQKTEIMKSGSAALASALKANLRYAETQQNFPILTDSKTDLFQFLFRLIDKNLAIGGYMQLDGSIASSLTKSIFSDSAPAFDVSIYEQEDSVYAIPSDISVSSDYSIDNTNIRNVRVGDQARVLSAMSHMAKFFSGVEENIYDVEFAKMKYLDFQIFPKSPFFEMSLGNASVVLRNLQRHGFYLIDRKSKVEYVKNIAKDKIGKNAVEVFLVDYDSSELSNFSYLSDLAKFSLAVNDFVIATKDIEKVNSSLVSIFDKNEQKNLKDIQAANLLGKKLSLGLNNFISSKLLAKDNSLFECYDVKQQKACKNKVNQADVYFEVILSLLKAYEAWNSKIYLLTAVDLYYYLNHHFLNEANFLYNKNIHLSAKSIVQHAYVLSEFASYREVLKNDSIINWNQASDQQLLNIIESYQMQILNGKDQYAK